MGNTPTLANSAYSAADIAAEAFVAVTQDIAQGAIAQQIVSINCNEGKSLEYCLDCKGWWKNYIDQTPGAIERLITPGQTQQEAIDMLCSAQCDCIAGNIDLSSHIKINMSTFYSSGAEDAFATQIKNSLSQKASSQGGGLDLGGNKQANISKNVTQLYQSMQSDSFKSSVSGLEAIQEVKLNGPGTVLNVRLDEAIDFVSKVLESDSGTQSIVSDLETSIIQATTQILDAGLAQLILIIVQIVVLIVIIIAIAYATNLVFEAYTLVSM
jgi:hypothetical protein